VLFSCWDGLVFNGFCLFFGEGFFLGGVDLFLFCWLFFVVLVFCFGVVVGFLFSWLFGGVLCMVFGFFA